jgi:hypothetical protein
MSKLRHNWKKPSPAPSFNMKVKKLLYTAINYTKTRGFQLTANANNGDLFPVCEHAKMYGKKIKWRRFLRKYRIIKSSLCDEKLKCIRTIPTTNDLKMAVKEYIRNVDRVILRTVLYQTRSSRTQFGMSINVWRLAGDTLNITCNFLYCNHQVHRDFLITLYNTSVFNYNTGITGIQTDVNNCFITWKRLTLN